MSGKGFDNFIMIKKDPLNCLYFTKAILTAALCVVLVSSLSAQRKVQYQADYEGKQMHFGFFLGAGPTSYKVKTNLVFQQNTNQLYTSITSPANYQLRIGGLINSRINDYFDFRMMPGVSITSRDIMLADTISKNDDLIRQTDKAWLEIPMMLKYKSERRGNVRMYVFGGFRYAYETNALNLVTRRSPTSTIKTRRSDFCIEYGMGLDAFMRYFKLSPELLFSHGITNMLQPTFVGGSLTPNQVMHGLNTHSVTLQFVFN